MSENSSNNKLPESTAAAPQGADDTRADLPPDLVERIEQEVRIQTVALFKHERHSGPMPSPKQFEQYEKVLPGTALAIRNEFQANGEHVRKMEERALTAQKDDNDKNRASAERLVWGALIASVFLALMGHPWVAGTIAVSTVGAVITGFLNRARETQPQAPAPTGETEPESPTPPKPPPPPLP